MRDFKNYFLPSLSFLKSWASKINIKQGIQRDILKFMSLALEEFTDTERCTVLQFDEVKVKNKD